MTTRDCVTKYYASPKRDKMIKEQIITEFKNAFCTYKTQSLRGIGIECEIPVVTEEGEAVSLSVIQAMFSYLKKQGFEIEWDESTDLMIAAKRTNHKSAEKFDYHFDTITTDTAFSTLEIVLAPQDNLHTIQEQLSNLLQTLLPFFNEKKVLLLGYGIQPLTSPSRKLLMPKERYRFFEKLSTNNIIPISEGADSSFLNLSASNQCHLEINAKDAIRATNVLNALSGLQIILHANSPIWKGQIDPNYKASREMFWDISFPNRRNQTGIPPKFENIESYVDYLFQFKPSLVKREGRYLQILNKTTFEEYLLNTFPAIGCTIDGKQLEVEPKKEDFQQLIPFSWFNVRLVPKYGTIESRMCCQQPFGSNLTTAALTLGIIENLPAAEELSNIYSLAHWRVIRKQAAHHGFDTRIKGESILPLLKDMLDVATEGLQKRDLQEAVFLQPLYKRLEQRQAPADVAIKVFKEGGMDALLKQLSLKKEDYKRHLSIVKQSTLATIKK